MTMRTVDKLKCECGHTGSLHTSENDQPYSSPWVSRKLEGFNGNISEAETLELVQCPNCGQTGKVHFAKKP